MSTCSVLQLWTYIIYFLDWHPLSLTQAGPTTRGWITQWIGVAWRTLHTFYLGRVLEWHTLWWRADVEGCWRQLIQSFRESPIVGVRQDFGAGHCIVTLSMGCVGIAQAQPNLLTCWILKNQEKRRDWKSKCIQICFTTTLQVRDIPISKRMERQVIVCYMLTDVLYEFLWLYPDMKAGKGHLRICTGGFSIIVNAWHVQPLVESISTEIHPSQVRRARHWGGHCRRYKKIEFWSSVLHCLKILKMASLLRVTSSFWA